MTIVILILIQFVTLAVECLTNQARSELFLFLLHLLLSYDAQSCKTNIRTPPLYLYSCVIRSPCLFKLTVSKIVVIISKSGIFRALQLVLLIHKYWWQTQCCFTLWLARYHPNVFCLQIKRTYNHFNITLLTHYLLTPL